MNKLQSLIMVLVLVGSMYAIGGQAQYTAKVKQVVKCQVTDMNTQAYQCNQ